MAKQYILPINEAPAEYNIHDFIFSNSNKALQEILNNLPNSSGVLPYKNIMLILGENSAGKTHFTHLFAANTDAAWLKGPTDSIEEDFVIIDDIDKKWGEEDLFHMFNYICENKKTALFTAKNLDNIKLRDLKSRLDSVRLFKIGPPDDDMVKALLSKHFSSRNIVFSEDMIKFLMVRIARNYEAIFQSIDLIDKAALEKKRNVNMSFLASLF